MIILIFFADSSCKAGGGKETEPSSVKGRRIGGVTAQASMAVLIAAN